MSISQDQASTRNLVHICASGGHSLSVGSCTNKNPLKRKISQSSKTAACRTSKKLVLSKTATTNDSDSSVDEDGDAGHMAMGLREELLLQNDLIRDSLALLNTRINQLQQELQQFHDGQDLKATPENTASNTILGHDPTYVRVSHTFSQRVAPKPRSQRII
ncbi:hypothetical protein EIP86_010719 [Pleurotus ostreatoroseus]|nr:hypothetical protein EIP86_010719 [Pleurotus ostreatoroseus]